MIDLIDAALVEHTVQVGSISFQDLGVGEAPLEMPAKVRVDLENDGAAALVNSAE